MKKIVPICIILALLSCLYGCGNTESDTLNSEVSSSESTSSSVNEEVDVPKENNEKSIFLGTYTSDTGWVLTLEGDRDFKLKAPDGSDLRDTKGYFEFNDGIISFPAFSIMTIEKENGKPVVKFNDDSYYTVYGIFTKDGEYAENDKSASSDESPNTDGNTVDPKLKAFLDEYEDFMDSYINAMQKLDMSDPDALKAYTDYMSDYYDYMEALEKYDTDTMSTADSLYYLEVTERVTKKLMAASLN